MKLPQFFRNQRTVRGLWIRPREQVVFAMSLVAVFIFLLAMMIGGFAWQLKDLLDDAVAVEPLLRREFLEVACSYFFALGLTTFFAGFLLSHRIFGPVVPIVRHIRRLRNGEFDSRVHLREHDSLGEIGTELNELAVALEEETKRKREAGFSLLEVMVAAGVMGVIALGALSLERSGILSRAPTQYLFLGRTAAQKKILEPTGTAPSRGTPRTPPYRRSRTCK